MRGRGRRRKIPDEKNTSPTLPLVSSTMPNRSHAPRSIRSANNEVRVESWGMGSSFWGKWLGARRTREVWGDWIMIW